MDINKKKFLFSLLWLLFIPVTFVLTKLANANPDYVERIYSDAIYPRVANAIPFQYIPGVSFFEIILFAVPILVVAGIIFFIVRLVRNKNDRLWRILRVVRSALIVCGIVYFLFYLCWGFNYSRLPYSEIAGLPVRDSSTSELRDLCTSLIERTNEARRVLPSDEDGALGLQLSAAELRNITQDAYIKANEDSIPGIRDIRTSPKNLRISGHLSYTGITGIYFPFTAEANYNDDVPMPLMGAAICHELAHRQGFAREDEANFISFLVCTGAQDSYLNYSGLLLATNHAMNKLHDNDRESYRELYALYSDEVAYDLAVDRAYWDLHSGKVEETVTRMNDSYLKSNNLADGVKSYGRMVDLLLAQWRMG